MSSKMMAKIKWLTEEQGGRQTIPWGDKYGPIAIIKGDLLNSTEAVWSLLVSNKELVSEFETIAEIKYLFEYTRIAWPKRLGLRDTSVKEYRDSKGNVTRH